MFSIFYFCFIVLMVSLYFLFILSDWPRVLEFLGNFWICLASCSNCLFSVSYVLLYQDFECLFFFIGLFLCFSVLSAHSFINLVKLWIIYWKLLLFFLLSKSLQRILIVICDSWPFIKVLKRGGILAISVLGFWQFWFFSLEFSMTFESSNNW